MFTIEQLAVKTKEELIEMVLQHQNTVKERAKRAYNKRKVQTVECSCGTVVKVSSLDSHKSSQKHTKDLATHILFMELMKRQGVG